MAIKNVPPFMFVVNTLEARVTATPAKDTTAGANAVSAAHTFEGRAVQETGTH